MRLDGLRAHGQLRRHLAVGEAARRELGNLLFARRELVGGGWTESDTPQLVFGPRVWGALTRFEAFEDP
jgi:hypothetical protein